MSEDPYGYNPVPLETAFRTKVRYTMGEASELRAAMLDMKRLLLASDSDVDEREAAWSTWEALLQEQERQAKSATTPTLDARAFVQKCMEQGDFYDRGCEEGERLHSNAIDELAAELLPHLASGQADDGEPITEDWLRSVGFKSGLRIELGRLQFTNYKGWNAWWAFSDMSGAIRLVNDVKTRGDLRRLCKCLGVQLGGTSDGS